MLEQELLCDQTAQTEDVTEETLFARQLIQAVGQVVPVTKKSYVVLIRDLATDLRDVRWGAENVTEKFAKPEARFSELDLRVQLFVEETEHAGDL